MWLVNRNTKQTKGQDDERVLYVASRDGNTLTWRVLNASKPSPKGETNVIVWDRVH